MMRNVTAPSLLLLGLCVGGCRSPDLVKAPHGPVDDPLPEGAYPRIVLLDHLQKSLVGSRVLVDPASGDATLRVRATLRSVVDRELPVQYRFVFLGKDGASVSDNPVWMSMTFAARTERVLTESAPTYSAVDWKLEVRKFR